jgi:hypothetical protein
MVLTSGCGRSLHDFRVVHQLNVVSDTCRIASFSAEYYTQDHEIPIGRAFCQWTVMDSRCQVLTGNSRRRTDFHKGPRT